MPGYRPERVGEMIFRELAERLRSQIKDPRVVPISITAVEVTRDLSRAVVSYMPLGGGEPQAELREGLEVAAKQLRGPIGRALKLRHAPELVFTYDERTDAAFRVTAILDRLSAERRARDEAPVEEEADDNGQEGDEGEE
jgi:ribosome-binding factor A